MRWYLPSVRVSDDRHCGVDAADHRRSIDEVVLGGNGDIGHAKSRGGSSSATIDASLVA